ncbi:porin family protein [Parashewanella tropica]|uniref:porin family protein n=1 Tax=Parashewanella tropica TaxID=2547970 RepID=UPI00105A6D9F|nr:porin family protein [Parashewanella tropica]
MEMRAVLLFKLVKRIIFVPLISLLSFLIANAYANDEDTQLRLEQQAEQGLQKKEQAILQDEMAREARDSKLTINGRTYHVNNNVNELGRALYLAVQHKMWPAVKEFLPRYQAIVTHDLMLVLYAEGGLARHAGNLTQAENKYRQLLILKPDFILAKLELARVLFENHKNNEAAKQFAEIEKFIPKYDPKTQGVQATIAAYSKAIRNRDEWHGFFSFGPSFDSNINQASGLTDRVLTSPFVTPSMGVGIETSLERRWSLSNHNGIQWRTLLFASNYYGESYVTLVDRRNKKLRDHSEFSQGTYITKLGYSYKEAKNQLFIAPLFELKLLDKKAFFTSVGLTAEWLRFISPTTMMKLELNYKKQEFIKPDLRLQNGIDFSSYFTLWKRVSDKLTMFGGMDYSQKRARDTNFNSDNFGLRLGLSYPLTDGINTTVFSSFRNQSFKGYNAFFRDTRKDNTQNYTIIVKAPKHEFAGLVPSLQLNYGRSQSSHAVLYSFDKHAVHFKLEKQF